MTDCAFSWLSERTHEAPCACSGCRARAKKRINASIERFRANRHLGRLERVFHDGVRVRFVDLLESRVRRRLAERGQQDEFGACGQQVSASAARRGAS